MSPDSYYSILAQRHPALPQDVRQAMDLYDQANYDVVAALARIKHCKGRYWDSVRVNVRRCPLPWAQAVQVLRA